MLKGLRVLGHIACESVWSRIRGLGTYRGLRFSISDFSAKGLQELRAQCLRGFRAWGLRGFQGLVLEGFKATGT